MLPLDRVPPPERSLDRFPPLTARLPPAVHRQHASDGLVSSTRLRILEESLQALEMEDWRVERLLSEYSPQDEGRYADKVNSMQRNSLQRYSHEPADTPYSSPYLSYAYGLQSSESLQNHSRGPSRTMSEYSHRTVPGHRRLDMLPEADTKPVAKRSSFFFYEATSLSNEVMLQRSQAQTNEADSTASLHSTVQNPSKLPTNGIPAAQTESSPPHVNHLDQSLGLQMNDNCWESSGDESESASSDSAMKMLDRMLGQYFIRSEEFQQLLVPDSQTVIEWEDWWAKIERSVRREIKPEMKAVFEGRCRDLYSQTKTQIMRIFHLYGDEQEKMEVQQLVHILSSLDDYVIKTVAAIDYAGSHISWPEFWSATEGKIKTTIKESVRRSIKNEMHVKFAEWKYRFHDVFKNADIEGRGRVAGSSFVASLLESPFGNLLHI
ncbi:hypothetical protein GUITHDRAFT_108506 [Guillardia theta CCMP2712]|uniref:EF-hand domain-containing protein n=2 Tax=Guillardia theta TaxID=55529 RepID=L1JC06_GUITC|nr:hypothetical protein GUITHDRAFT_108506 [Guillardia theta CCMP2712]EKX45630.1 hypothetical protein GUITHDRAFT_108506 [Guillardia theta CCMP2712]|mmetsp:Transcript_14741/g.50289  ORF Transcript_14741/g.50289 Transcript_14741/m.50289 type:complete len:436 (+) Transcript_14741:246-1553(+)|eukprot:XP_005832610.1 hypothetical protein GUITHDRAFT_108506 [Guillardia theta CCMP2712]